MRVATEVSTRPNAATVGTRLNSGVPARSRRCSPAAKTSSSVVDTISVRCMTSMGVRCPANSVMIAAALPAVRSLYAALIAMLAWMPTTPARPATAPVHAQSEPGPRRSGAIGARGSVSVPRVFMKVPSDRCDALRVVKERSGARCPGWKGRLSRPSGIAAGVPRRADVVHLPQPRGGCVRFSRRKRTQPPPRPRMPMRIFPRAAGSASPRIHSGISGATLVRRMKSGDGREGRSQYQ